jgi:hypothetical protein
MKIELTKEEAYYIERTSDFESSLALKRIFDIVSIPKGQLTKEEFELLSKYTSELINTYTILKNLRNKLEKLRK